MMGVLVAAMAALAGTPATAGQAVPVSPDEKCLAVLVARIGETDRKEGAEPSNDMMMAAMFFLGKVKGKDPSADIEQKMRAAIPVVENSSGPELIRCGNELGVVGAELIAAGDAMQIKP